MPQLGQLFVKWDNCLSIGTTISHFFGFRHSIFHLRWCCCLNSLHQKKLWEYSLCRLGRSILLFFRDVFLLLQMSILSFHSLEVLFSFFLFYSSILLCSLISGVVQLRIDMILNSIRYLILLIMVLILEV